MAVGEIVLDTNGYTAFQKGNSEAVEVMAYATQIYVSTIVLGELLAGFVVGSREAKNRVYLQTFLLSPRVEVVTITDSTAEWYATIYKELRTKGRPIPTNDMWIAATAREKDCALFTYDAHFTNIDDLTVGNTMTALQII